MKRKLYKILVLNLINSYSMTLLEINRYLDMLTIYNLLLQVFSI